MKKSLALLACFFLFPSVAQAGDVFTGTLEVRDGKPLLVRCDLVKNTYVLEDADGNPAPWLKQLEALGITPEKPCQATVVGEVRGVSADPAFLTVERIENIRPGSCHMTDFLGDMAREAEERQAKDSKDKAE